MVFFLMKFFHHLIKGLKHYLDKFIFVNIVVVLSPNMCFKWHLNNII